MIIGLTVSGLFLVLSIIFLAGKGSFLIAGYNTASHEEKVKYDEKKLCRTTGVMSLLIAILVLLMTIYHSMAIIIVCLIISVITGISCLLYMNMKCKKPEIVIEQNNNKVPETKNYTLARMFIGIGISVVVVIVVVINIFSSSKPPVYTITDGTFSISSAYGQKINLSEIKKIQLRSDLPENLSRTNGFNAGTILKGKFSSNIGNLFLYIDTFVPEYIYITTKSKQVILNNQSKEKTEDLYNELSSAINREPNFRSNK